MQSVVEDEANSHSHARLELASNEQLCVYMCVSWGVVGLTSNICMIVCIMKVSS